MTLSDLGNIGEFIGAIGVIASLIYVGFEVRRNTKALRAQAHETVVSGYMASIQVFADHAETIAKAFRSSYEEFRTFSDAEKVIFFGAIYGFFKHFEQIYTQYKQGLIGLSEWEAWNEHIRMQFHQPGVQWWWRLRRTSFSESFRTYLDNSVPPDMTSMVEVFQDNEGGVRS